MDPAVSRSPEEPACGSLHHMFDLFSADTFLRVTINERTACFDFDEMEDSAASGDEVDFVTAMAPVSPDDDETVTDQPVRGQILSFPAEFDMG